MNSNELIKMMVIILVIIALIGTVALVAVMKLTEKQDQRAPSADEIVASSIDISEITTNLADGSYVKVSFKIQTDSEEGKEEAENAIFKLKILLSKNFRK